MADTKTGPAGISVAAFLDAVEPAERRQDAQSLDALFQRVTGFAPQMWGSSMVGYGRYAYTYASGHSGEAMATGFAPRKANMVVYIVPGYRDLTERLARLGKHKIGKSCLYFGRLADVDLTVLQEIIRAGLDDLGGRYAIRPA